MRKRPVLGRVLLLGGLVFLGILLAACGSDSQNNQSRQPLRLTLRFDTGYVDEPYNTTLTADGGVRPYRFTLEGNLPRGLVYSNGRISGTPQEKGSFELTVSVEDANLSNRTQKVTLVIGETPPPRLDQVFPLAEVSDPFPYLFRVRDREARGFQAQIPLKDLKLALDSFKADASLLYVLRYDEEKGLVDIDAVFTSPRKDLEAFRFTATPLPDKKVRPEASFRETRVAFYDKNGKLAGNAQAIERVATQGQYRYSDLEAIARNWGRRLTPASPPTSENNPPQSQGSPTAPASENQAAGTTQQTPPAAPADQTASEPAQPPQPGQASPTQPGQAPPPQPGQAPPEQAQPAQPEPANAPQGQVAPAPSPQAQRLEGDLNGDGVVDQKDLELLRSSYAWASVGAGSTTPPSTPTPPPGNPQPGSGTPGSSSTNPGNGPNPDQSEGK
ncbi:Ig family protein [Meiothermus ruber]|uniref:Ig family protein n=1 Tax=Meiothermus ruber (strain ATCC 35948 / DSM 1279 / VKM B-1258 / 21) TaxID=504728 RepID=D3PPG4_MEIRD|nr:Ig family protein [Meiothermus ruber]ADD29578.1 Ig family protein [Meiothermus ruber DSM 1279]AGK04969.1 Ig family protein [Meiothermus ruber DSM 1279]MCL6530352.1 Ig family protein [Meiothermus ruber]GAO76495.1 Ig family protein [Meiothermus ruber H328]